MRVLSCYYHHALRVSYCLWYIAQILLLITSSSATFQRPLFYDFEESASLWKGKPSASILFKSYRVCADETYWSAAVADRICRYKGFEGTMLINEMTSNSERDYVVCRVIIGSSHGIECEAIDVCEKEPVISCILPGYHGCFVNTASSPFFTNGAQASNDESQPFDIKSCAAASVQYPYLGLTDGQDCICGSNLGNMDEGVCDLSCLQNEFEACGGANAISVYGANVIGKCSLEQTNLPPNKPVHILSPQFPDTFDAGSACTWTLIIDVEKSYNLGVSYLIDLQSTGDGSVIVSSVSESLSLTFQGGPISGGTSFNPYPVLQDTITVDLTSSGKGVGSFIIKFSLTPHSTQPTEPSLMTEAPIDKTTTYSLSTKQLTSLSDMETISSSSTSSSFSPFTSSSSPTSFSPSSSSSSPSSFKFSTILSYSTSSSLPPSTSTLFLSRSLNEQAIYAGVGVAVGLAVLLALGIVYMVSRGKIGGSGPEKPAGLVGYHNKAADVVITTPSHHALAMGQSGLNQENHTSATIADDHYLVPDATGSSKIDAEKLKGQSSERVAMPNDYKL